MTRKLEGVAECQARFYFSDLLSWVKDLHAAHLSISAAFSSLLREYGEVFPRSKLQLYPRNRPLHGPTALYWGEVVTLNLKSIPKRIEAKKVVRHLTGPFKVAWVFTLAKRMDMVERFLDFDRRRLAINAASRTVLLALNHLRNVTSRKFPLKDSPTIPSSLDPGTKRPVPTLPPDPLPTGLPPRLIQFIRSGWIAVFSLALAEEESCELALEVAENPSAEGLRIDISDREEPSYSRNIRWALTGTGELIPKLTDRMMRKLHLREGVRPVLSLKERKRRRIEKALTYSGRALDSIRKKCEAAQVAVTSGLIEGRVILLETRLNEDSRSLPAAG